MTKTTQIVLKHSLPKNWKSDRTHIAKEVRELSIKVGLNLSNAILCRAPNYPEESWIMRTSILVSKSEHPSIKAHI